MKRYITEEQAERLLSDPIATQIYLKQRAKGNMPEFIIGPGPTNEQIQKNIVQMAQAASANGFSNNLKYHIKRVSDWMNRFQLTRYLQMLGTRNAEKQVRVRINPVGKDGTSYTDGYNIVITLWMDLLDKTLPIIKTAAEGFVAHEAEHCRSSNLPDQRRCAQLVGEFYNKKYGYNAKAGENLGSTLYNIIEDGRIERIAVNRFPGLLRAFKYINAIIWRKNTLDLNIERNVYSDFISAILCLAKTGIKPKNWDVLYLNNEQDDLLNKIAYIIYDATCSDFTEDVVQAVLKVNKIIDPWIHEAIAKDAEFMDQLEKMAADGTGAENDAQKQQSQSSSNGGGISINAPKGISGGQSNGQQGQSQGQGQGSSGGPGAGVGNKNGANSAEDALNSAEHIDKSVEDLENEINNDEDLQQSMKDREDQVADENQANSDDELSEKDLNELEKDTGLSFGDAQIEHFQQALQDSTCYEPTPEIMQDGNMIYNKLKNLFIKRQDNNIRFQRRGKLDMTRLANMSAMRQAGKVEDKVFYKIKKAIEASCAATIIVDRSGSTSGYIFDEEFAACAKIEMGFARLIPFKIAAYDSSSDFRYSVIRDFNNRSHGMNYCYNFMKQESAGGGTPTGEAMALAGYELLKRKEKNKLMIILTDGEPDNNQKVKEQCKKLRKKGIKVIAILISEGTPSSYTLKDFNDMYEGKDIITEKPSQIASKLTTILSKWILGSFKK